MGLEKELSIHNISQWEIDMEGDTPRDYVEEVGLG